MSAAAFVVSAGLFIGASVADVRSTIDCRERNGCIEQNPLFGQRPSAQRLVATTIVIDTAVVALAWKLHKERPGAAIGVLIGGAFLHMLATHHNDGGVGVRSMQAHTDVRELGGPE